MIPPFDFDAEFKRFLTFMESKVAEDGEKATKLFNILVRSDDLRGELTRELLFNAFMFGAKAMTTHMVSFMDLTVTMEKEK